MKKEEIFDSNSKKSLKKIICLMLVLVICINTTVGASTIFNSKDITYSSDKTSKKNVKDALDEIYSIKSNYTFFKTIASKVDIGDYISMTPTSKSYLISTSLTGYDSVQTINPSELNLWRVLRKYSDGSVEIISQYASTAEISFTGKIGYMNLVGGLNQISKQYTDGIHVEGARHFGYNGQTEFIADRSKIDSTTIPWKSSTKERNEGYPVHDNKYEQLGGGDNKNDVDWNLLLDVFNTAVTNNPAGVSASHWVASRYYVPWSDMAWAFCHKTVTTEGHGGGGFLYASDQGERTRSHSIRPVLKIKANVLIKSGDGKSAKTAYVFK